VAELHRQPGSLHPRHFPNQQTRSEEQGLGKGQHGWSFPPHAHSQPFPASESQFAKPGVHRSYVHLPALHDGATTFCSWVAQLVPQAPQWFGSEAVSLQTPSQHFGLAPVQGPALQPPQLKMSVCVSTHSPSQQVLVPASPQPPAPPSTPPSIRHLSAHVPDGVQA
jgi:hypothetical protein